MTDKTDTRDKAAKVVRVWCAFDGADMPVKLASFRRWAGKRIDGDGR